MRFNWEKFIQLAENIQLHKSEEAYRTAISRSYYGIFCTIRDLNQFEQYKKSDIHSKIIAHFKQSNDINDQWIGKLLDELRKYRNNADYDSEKVITEELSQKCLLSAKQILQHIK
ncbi:MAG TPA: HEPN domain-containing protein [Candidatus Kapabacteria bacterium]|nr:HEPN domain-containing protein [Candidatus Kapabacteria bacterium]HOV92532.1 HEPN domain-containing protein [Candidatus Kapabacteria bacterium]